MPSYRLARSARADIGRILAVSAEQWGSEGRRRYAALIAAAMRKAAGDPIGAITRDRGELWTGLRSFHLRHARGKDSELKVRKPVHILYYQVIGPDLIRIVRVLHERVEPGRHLRGEELD